MSEDDKPKDESLAPEEEEAARRFLQRSFPYVFEQTILDAKTAQEREELARKFGSSSVIDFDSLTNLIGYVGYVRNEGREEDSLILLQYAKRAMNVFLDVQTAVQKNGISIQYIYQGRVIQSLGHCLNEGVTEMYTQMTLKEMAKDKGTGLDFTGKNSAEHSNTDGTYLLEVRCAEHLVSIFGDQPIGKAYFGDLEDWQTLVQLVDEKFGAGSFMKLLGLSDQGKWREVFGMLRTGTSQ